MSRSKPGHRVAQRLEAITKQFVPSLIDQHRPSSKMALPPTRRVVTGHDSNGKAIFVADEKLQSASPLHNDGTPPPPTVPGFTLIGKTKGFPDTSVNDVEFTDLHGTRQPLTDESGVTCRVVTFPPLPPDAPEEVNIMHRTQSWDIGVVLEGTIQLALDSGEEKEIGVGEVVVQRGTNHAWKNTYGETCRMLFVLVPSDSIKDRKTGGVLEPTDTRHLTTEEGAKALMAKITAQMAAKGGQ